MSPPDPQPLVHGKDTKHFIAANGLPYQFGSYSIGIKPTTHLTEPIKIMLGVENPKSTPTGDGYVETTFTSSICGSSVIKHLPNPKT